VGTWQAAGWAPSAQERQREAADANAHLQVVHPVRLHHTVSMFVQRLMTTHERAFTPRSEVAEDGEQQQG
jgi:hypothetical protein